MQRNISFRQYRAMDLFFFTAVLCLSELLITLGATRWFRAEAYTLSFSCAVMAIVMVRWGIWAAVPVAAGSLVLCLVSGAAFSQYVIYLAGSMLGLGMLLFLKKIGWQKVTENLLLCLAYGLLTAWLMQLGRMGVALLMGYPFSVCIGFLATDILSALFSVLLVGIARKLDGMLEEQTHYLKRVQEEQKKQGI